MAQNDFTFPPTIYSTGLAIQLLLIQSGLNHDEQAAALATAHLALVRKVAASTGGGV